jgi:hypothetical protein
MSSLEFLERKRKAIDTVIAAYKAFRDALQELPPEWAEEVLNDLRVNESPTETENDEKEEDDEDGEDGEPKLPPTRAVLVLLGQAPEGLFAWQIIDELVNKIDTTSKSPNKLLYSTLGQMKTSERIIQLSDGSYILPRFAARLSESSESEPEPEN